jgi:hypothetical protein
MSFFQIRIITLLKFLGNSGQMHPYQADLSAIGFVLRKDLQNTARVRLGKNMRGFLQIERHDMRSASGDLIQPLFARFSCRMNRRCYQESQADKHDQALFICRFGFKFVRILHTADIGMIFSSPRDIARLYCRFTHKAIYLSMVIASRTLKLVCRLNYHSRFLSATIRFGPCRGFCIKNPFLIKIQCSLYINLAKLGHLLITFHLPRK